MILAEKINSNEQRMLSEISMKWSKRRFLNFSATTGDVEAPL